ncbi:MAG: hypothetical protein R3A10_13640 [Caldilineaceae bacterium]
MLLKLGEVEQLVGHWDEAGQAYAQALELAARVGDTAALPCANWPPANSAVSREYSRADAWFQAAGADFAQHDDAEGTAKVLHVR